MAEASTDNTIPADVRAALRDYLLHSGLSDSSADGLLEALSIDLSDGYPDAVTVRDRLVQAATEAAAERIMASVREIAELASIPVAPELPEDAEVY